MRIVQLSDFHFTAPTWNPLRLASKRFFGQLNWLLTRKDFFSIKPLEELPELFASLQPDWILLGGDFASTALDAEFSLARQYIDQFSQPWIAVAGNHDHYTFSSYRKKQFYRYFSNLPPSSLSLKDDALEVHALAPQWRLIALDTARPTPPLSSRGLFSSALEEKLERALQEIPPDCHVIILNHYPFFQNDAPHRTLERGEALEALLRRHRSVRLYLHGHTHRRIIADLQSDGLPLILDSGCAAQKESGSWNLIDLDEWGARVQTYSYLKAWKPEREERILWKK